MPVDSGTIASQTGAAGGLWTHTPVDWRGNEGPTAQPGGWPTSASLAVPPNGSTASAAGTSPTISAVSVTAITATTATVNYTIAGSGTISSQAQYGTTAALGSALPVSPNTGTGAKTAGLTGLTTATPYFYRVVASTAGGGTTYSTIATFTTA